MVCTDVTKGGLRATTPKMVLASIPTSFLCYSFCCRLKSKSLQKKKTVTVSICVKYLIIIFSLIYYINVLDLGISVIEDSKHIHLQVIQVDCETYYPVIYSYKINDDYGKIKMII